MSEIKRAIDHLIGVGLTSTNPYLVDDTTLHDFTENPGYVLYVLEAAVLNATSVTNVEGGDISTLSLAPGHYHFVMKTLQLVSGKALVYRTHK
tara:strand:+ start:18952 stop:19230 length:279 start_codon:yes stop_codon:yes gene_type:complete